MTTILKIKDREGREIAVCAFRYGFNQKLHCGTVSLDENKNPIYGSVFDSCRSGKWAGSKPRLVGITGKFKITCNKCGEREITI